MRYTNIIKCSSQETWKIFNESKLDLSTSLQESNSAGVLMVSHLLRRGQALFIDGIVTQLLWGESI